MNPDIQVLLDSLTPQTIDALEEHFREELLARLGGAKRPAQPVRMRAPRASTSVAIDEVVRLVQGSGVGMSRGAVSAQLGIDVMAAGRALKAAVEAGKLRKFGDKRTAVYKAAGAAPEVFQEPEPEPEPEHEITEPEKVLPPQPVVTVRQKVFRRHKKKG